MLSTGVDILAVPRVEVALQKFGDRFLQRCFTPMEIKMSRGHHSEYAVRYAAKEAVSKALGVGLRLMAHNGVHFHDVEILNDRFGKPYVVLHGRAKDRADELGLTEWSISLTHEREYAVAFVVAIGS
jgi:holo-[acyl-carrier protein] synthase